MLKWSPPTQSTRATPGSFKQLFWTRFIVIRKVEAQIEYIRVLNCEYAVCFFSTRASAQNTPCRLLTLLEMTFRSFEGCFPQLIAAVGLNSAKALFQSILQGIHLQQGLLLREAKQPNQCHSDPCDFERNDDIMKYMIKLKCTIGLLIYII